MVAGDYFEDIAERVFSEVLSNLGGQKVVSSPELVRYETAEWFVEIFVLPSDGPRYSPRVAIGPLPELGPLTRHKQVDVMHTAPEGSSLRNYNLDWRYTNRDELRTALCRVRDELFVPYAVKVLTNPFALRLLVKSRSQQIESEWHEEIAEHNASVYRAKARTALDTKDYLSYLALMEKVPIERQSKSERARVTYVRKKFGS